MMSRCFCLLLIAGVAAHTQSDVHAKFLRADPPKGGIIVDPSSVTEAPTMMPKVHVPEVHAPEAHVPEMHAPDFAHAFGPTKHPPPSNTSLSVSLCLMGSVAFILLLFYFVNYWDADVRKQTWNVLTATIGIFLAVLIYGVVKRMVLDMCILAGAVEDRNLVMVCAMVLYPILYSMTQFLLYKLRDEHSRLLQMAVGLLVAHISGFAAMYGFSGLQQSELFASSLSMSLACVGVASVVMLLMSLTTTFVREKIALADDGQVDEDEERWFEETEEAEDDAMSLALGFLVMQVIRYAICGSLQPWRAHVVPPAEISQIQIDCLLGWTLCVGVFEIVWMKFHNAYIEGLGYGLPRMSKLFGRVQAVSAGWCMLFWAEYQVYEFGFDEARISGTMIVALMITVISLVQLLLFSIPALKENLSSYTHDVILTTGVAVGFAWEKCFDVAMEDIDNSGDVIGLPHTVMTFVQAITLVLVVLPAWYYYILPNSLEKIGEEYVPVARVTGLKNEMRKSISPRLSSSAAVNFEG